MGSFNTNPQSDPSTANNTSSNTQTQLEMMCNHIARLEQQKEELMHKLEESKVEWWMFDNSEDNEGENEQGLDEEDKEPRSRMHLSTLQSTLRTKGIPTWVLLWAVCQALNLHHSSDDGDYPPTLSLPYWDIQSPIHKVIPQRHPILKVPTLCSHRSPAQVYAGLQEILCQVKEELWQSRWGTDCRMTTWFSEMMRQRRLASTRAWRMTSNMNSPDYPKLSHSRTSKTWQFILTAIDMNGYWQSETNNQRCLSTPPEATTPTPLTITTIPTTSDVSLLWIACQ